MTHAVNSLPGADYIIVMDRGHVTDAGPLEELTQRKNGLATYLYDYNNQKTSHSGTTTEYRGTVGCCCFSTKSIRNNAWVTVNNDFLVMSEVICQWFLRVTASRVKIIGKSHQEWPKNRYSRVTNVSFYFLHAILCPENTILIKTIIDSSFRHCR